MKKPFTLKRVSHTLFASALFLGYSAFAQPATHLHFDGTNDHVTAAATGLPSGNAARTVEVWAKLPSSATASYSLVNYGTTTDLTNQRFGIMTISGRVFIVGQHNDYHTPAVVADGLWHHIAATHDGTTLKVYVDGVQVGTDQAKTYATTANVFFIGRRTWQNDEHFDGEMDEVRIWNRALSQADIVRRKNCELQGNETGLVAYYRFNQGTAGANNPGLTTLNNSATTAHGTLANFALTGAASNWLGGSPVASSCSAVCTYSVIAQGYGAQHTIAVKGDGTLWAWGYNEYGQVGNGTTTDQTVPIQVGIASDWNAVAVGGEHTVALKTNGTLWAWGVNSFGQLGNGTTTNQATPVQVGTATDWTAVVAGRVHTLALKANGTLWAWGDNSYGQLGDGTTSSKSSPIQVGTATDWTAVTAGMGHTLALKANGTLWAWGYNANGRLGNGTTTSTSAPVQVGTGTNWAAVAAGGNHTLAVKTDRTLWAWGANGNGQLGDGTTTQQTVPTQIGTATNWAGVSGGEFHSAAVKTDGTLWAWGRNSNGQLGNGTTTNQTSPVQAGTGTDWAGVVAARHETVGLKANRTLWAWGANGSGQLGDGTTTPRNRPNQTSSVFSPSLAASGTVQTTTQEGYNIFNNNCETIASLRSQGASPVTGSVTARVWVQASQPSQFVKRHYEITPATNAGTATGRVTLYFTQQEFDEFNAVNAVKLPASSADAGGKAALRIEKRGGTSGNGTGLPGSYTGSITTLDPTDADIVWNATALRWEVSLDVTGFSGFFVKTSSSLLPLQWLRVQGGLNAANQASLTWRVQEQNVTNYTVEKSSDGQTFTAIGTIGSKGNGTNDYALTESVALKGAQYYRIKQTGRDGRSSYSSVIRLSLDANGIVSLYPNPVKNTVNVSVSNELLHTQAELANAVGGVVQKLRINTNRFNINMEPYASGIYYLRLSNGATQKIVKE